MSLFRRHRYHMPLVLNFFAWLSASFWLWVGFVYSERYVPILTEAFNPVALLRQIERIVRAVKRLDPGKNLI